MYNSAQTGEAYVQELLGGHPDRIHDVLGVGKHVFRTLVQELKDCAGLEASKHLSCEEQVAIFLRLARTGLGQREARERFQRAPETVSLYVMLYLFEAKCSHATVCSTVYSKCSSIPASTAAT